MSGMSSMSKGGHHSMGGMSGMDGMSNMDGMTDMGSCKMSMLWNWDTIDSCFVAESWHVKSSGMFAGSCIGIILLVISLEFFHRLRRVYDRALVLQRRKERLQRHATSSEKQGPAPEEESPARVSPAGASEPAVRPTIGQQAVRALLHMVQFTIAYFIMLTAMSFNGYMIICIIIGAYIGGFIFQWEPIRLGDEKDGMVSYVR